MMRETSKPAGRTVVFGEGIRSEQIGSAAKRYWDANAELRLPSTMRAYVDAELARRGWAPTTDAEWNRVSPAGTVGCHRHWVADMALAAFLENRPEVAGRDAVAWINDCLAEYRHGPLEALELLNIHNTLDAAQGRSRTVEAV